MRLQQANLLSSMIVDVAKDWSGYNITNIGTINAVAIAAHKARHESGGADAFATGSLASGADPLSSTHKTRHEPGGGDAMDVDAAAATGSLRTLGAGAAQAAPGNHTHTLASEALSESEASVTPDSYSDPGDGRFLLTAQIAPDGDMTVATVADTFSALSHAIAGYGGVVGAQSTSSLKLQIIMGGVQVYESGYLGGGGTSTDKGSGSRALSGGQTVLVRAHNYNVAAKYFMLYTRGEAIGNSAFAMIVGSVAI